LEIQELIDQIEMVEKKIEELNDNIPEIVEKIEKSSWIKNAWNTLIDLIAFWKQPTPVDSN
jgi:prefoldin subunit 5